MLLKIIHKSLIDYNHNGLYFCIVGIHRKQFKDLRGGASIWIFESEYKPVMCEFICDAIQLPIVAAAPGGALQSAQTEANQ